MPCKLCGSPGTNASSCPNNPNALSPNPQKHPRAIAPAPKSPVPILTASQKEAIVNKAYSTWLFDPGEVFYELMAEYLIHTGHPEEVIDMLSEGENDFITTEGQLLLKAVIAKQLEIYLVDHPQDTDVDEIVFNLLETEFPPIEDVVYEPSEAFTAEVALIQKALTLSDTWIASGQASQMYMEYLLELHNMEDIKAVIANNPDDFTDMTRHFMMELSYQVVNGKDVREALISLFGHTGWDMAALKGKPKTSTLFVPVVASAGPIAAKLTLSKAISDLIANYGKPMPRSAIQYALSRHPNLRIALTSTKDINMCLKRGTDSGKFIKFGDSYKLSQ